MTTHTPVQDLLNEEFRIAEYPSWTNLLAVLEAKLGKMEGLNYDPYKRVLVLHFHKGYSLDIHKLLRTGSSPLRNRLFGHTEAIIECSLADQWQLREV